MTMKDRLELAPIRSGEFSPAKGAASSNGFSSSSNSVNNYRRVSESSKTPSTGAIATKVDENLAKKPVTGEKLILIKKEPGDNSEMAGVVPVTGKSGRKQWTLHDGPRNSLRRLRSQLAEDGCPESQVVLAKQLLEESCELDVDKEENSKLGVYWLTKASEQGNIEATQLLQQCIISGQGITEHNYHDIKNCLDMSQDEKLARRAAKEMFSRLCNGEDFITAEQLRTRLFKIKSHEDSLTNLKSLNGEQKLLNSTNNLSDDEEFQPFLKSDSKIQDILKDGTEQHTQKITEAALVSAATSYANGSLPAISQDLSLADSKEMELDSFPVLQRPFISPTTSLKRLYIWLIETLGEKNIPLRKFFFTTKIHLVILLILHTLLGSASLFSFLPTAMYYISFSVMLITTFQILQRRRELHVFRMWSRLFCKYSGGALNPEDAEYQFSRNNLKPYGIFFFAILINLLIYPSVANSPWMVQSEFTVLSLILTLITLINFSWDDFTKMPDLLVFFSFALNVLARYPYGTDFVIGQVTEFFDIDISNYSTVVMDTDVGFYLNFRILFYLLMPMVFLKIASRDNWHGIYKSLIPHCITLSWWQMAMLCSEGATMYGLIRGSIALVGVVLFLPIAFLASIILPVIAAKNILEHDFVTRTILTVLLGGMPFFASWCLKKTKTPKKYHFIITFLQILIGALSGILLIWPMIVGHKSDFGISPFDNNDQNVELTWEQYQNYCHQPAWEESSSKAQIQDQCSYLEGASISWEGYVTNVRIKSVKNNLGFMLNQFPQTLANPLKCLFGELYSENCSNIYNNNAARSINCNIFSNVLKKSSKCHVFAWNSYEFEISIKMKSGIWGSNTQIELLGDQSFSNFTLNIYPGDKIWFKGFLLNQGLEGESLLGGSNPHVSVNEIGCHVCHTSDLKIYKRKVFELTINDILTTLYLGSKTIFKFLFHPLIVQ